MLGTDELRFAEIKSIECRFIVFNVRLEHSVPAGNFEQIVLNA